MARSPSIVAARPARRASPSTAGITAPVPTGRPVHLSTLVRWVLRGVRTPMGVFRLDGVRTGGRWLPSADALRRFTERVTQPRHLDRPAKQQPANSPRAVERAEAELSNLGIG